MTHLGRCGVSAVALVGNTPSMVYKYLVMPGSYTRFIVSPLYHRIWVQPLEIIINLKLKKITLKSKESIWNTQ